MTIEKIFIETVTNVSAKVPTRVVYVRLNHAKLPFFYVKAEYWQLHIIQPNKNKGIIKFSVCQIFKESHFTHHWAGKKLIP